MPAPPAPATRCRGCRRPIIRTKPVNGYGPRCAKRRGLTRPQARPARWEQDGPSLFDHLPDDETNPLAPAPEERISP